MLTVVESDDSKNTPNSKDIYERIYIESTYS